MSSDIAITPLKEKIDELNQQAWEARVKDSEKAFELSKESVRLAREINYPKGLAEGLRSLGFGHVRLYKNEEAATLLSESLALFQSLNDLKGQGVVYEYLGIIERNRGNLGASLELLLKGDALITQVGDPEMETTSCYQIGVTYKHLGKHENALDYLYQALSRAKKIDFILMEAYAINIIGSIYFDNGDYTQALECYQRGLVIRRESNDKWGEAGSLDNIGFTYLKLRDVDRAIDYCKQSLAISQSTGDKKGEANALLHMAEIYEQAGDFRNAFKFSNESLEIRKARSDRRGEAEVLLFLADLHKTRNGAEDHQVLDWLLSAVKIAGEINAQDLLSKAYYNLHEHYSEKGDFKESLARLEDHLKIEKELHKNAINQKVSNLEISNKAEAISQRNKELTELNEQIEKANAELKIETALERVRTAAMAMKEPSDMLGICKIISHELASLEVKEIRNVQTAIFYEEKGSYMNYEYYSKHDKLLVTEVDYNNHPVAEKFANQMIKGANQVWTHAFKGQEVKDWLAYQKTTNVFIDPYLETAGSLDYYWYSLGPVALGMSTYASLNEGEIELFKRFRNVFELAYRRYMDIEKAYAQAREAQIEASLERVRAAAMAMHDPEDMLEVCRVISDQMEGLNVKDIRNVQTAIINQEKGIYLNYEYFTQYKRTDVLEIVISLHPAVEEFANEMLKSKDAIFFKSFEGEALDDWREYRRKTNQDPDPMLDIATELHYYFYSIGSGALGISVFSKLNEVEVELFKRFRNVFELAYRRFVDIEKAQAQAREAQIEASLERVRAKSMAMHHSDDLISVINVVKEQLIQLGFHFHGANFVTDYSDKGYTMWLAAPNESFPTKIYVPQLQQKLFKGVAEAVEMGLDFTTYTLSFEEKNTYFNNLFENSLASNTSEEGKKLIFESKGMAASVVLLNKIRLNLMNLDLIPYTDEENNILKRIAYGFEQSYIRFLDLKKAEAQAREAQIETALERIRARAMAMHSSNELIEVANILREQMGLLGQPQLETSVVSLYDKQSGMIDNWNAFRQPGLTSGTITTSTSSFSKDSSELTKEMATMYDTGKSEFTLTASGSKLLEFFDVLIKSDPLVASYAGRYVPDQAFYHFTTFTGGALLTVSYQPPSEETKLLQRRAASVFDMAYRRYLDLKKAEAQTREAQIETGLERVRSKTMAMHKSEEVTSVAVSLCEELLKLGFEGGSTIIIIDEKTGDTHQWTGFSEDKSLKSCYVPYFKHPCHDAVLNAWKKGEKFLVYTLTGDEKRSLDDHYFTTGYKIFPERDKKWMREMESVTFSHAFMKYGAIHWGPDHLTEEQSRILQRFSKVFEQSYTRFLDLQKAEAQAREAQIEAALERVRAKVMAMKTSNDLNEASLTFGEQLRKLGIDWQFSYFWLIEEEKEDNTFWITWPDGKTSTTTYSIAEADESFRECIVAWREQTRIHATHVGVQDVQAWLDTFERITQDAGGIAVDIMKPENFKQGVFYYDAMIRFGSFGILMNRATTEDERNIQTRFAVEFERAYTRFLDLQKAEAQTQKAKIETALEKVRARALAMQQPEELIEVAKVLRQEMGLLGVEELETCSIYIHDEAIQRTECWYALKDIRSDEKKLVSDHFSLTLDDTWVGRKMLEFFRSNAKQVSIIMQGSNRKEWINYCEEKSVPFRGYYGEAIPDRTYHLYRFSHGAIGAASAGDISTESWDLLQRAASVFSLAYSRFKDLTQARNDLVKLKEEKKRAEDALTELQATQKQLIQSEKMASLGELTAGIAHEIQNPLNFVNNFSDVSNELLDEMEGELATGNMQSAKEIVKDVKDNLEKILHHGKRADAIVKSMLQHSRSGSSKKEPTDINALTEEYFRLAFHGLRAKDKSFNAKFETDLDPGIDKVNIVPQEMGRVILNLINNAFYAVNEKKKTAGNGYEPVVTISTKYVKPSVGRLPAGQAGLGVVEIKVKDNGNGIPHKALDKIFQPFFTTKPTGQGTGLGLSLSYDIVTKGHGGDIKVETKEGEGSEFIISLPMNN